MTDGKQETPEVPPESGAAASSGGRRKVIILAVLVALLGLVSAVVALSRGGGGGDARSITVELAGVPDGGQELLITVSEDLNVPATAKGATLVNIACRNESGQVLLQSQQSWPLQRDGDPPRPHAHISASRPELRTLAVCRIDGTSPALEGRVGLQR